MDIEKTYDVSKEAMKGFIHLVNTDLEKRQIDVVYRVRAKKNQSKFITYSFDMDFNFLSQSEEMVDMEKELPTKYRPKKYRGDGNPCLETKSHKLQLELVSGRLYRYHECGGKIEGKNR
jgi:hypothetical protein